MFHWPPPTGVGTLSAFNLSEMPCQVVALARRRAIDRLVEAGTVEWCPILTPLALTLTSVIPMRRQRAIVCQV